MKPTKPKQLKLDRVKGPTKLQLITRQQNWDKRVLKGALVNITNVLHGQGFNPRREIKTALLCSKLYLEDVINQLDEYHKTIREAEVKRRTEMLEQLKQFDAEVTALSEPKGE